MIIWNPWHGCVKKSEGCDHCYMYYLDSKRDMDGSVIFKTGNFRQPIQHDRRGNFKVPGGSELFVCLTSDFFLEEADQWRQEAWQMMRMRSDVKFTLTTKRPERIAESLPPNWGDSWENVLLTVTCENQRRTDERLPILLDLPFKHKGVMAEPLLGPIVLEQYLESCQIERVVAGGENYDGCRPCDFDWIRSLAQQCRRQNTTFVFMETGTKFIKDGKLYHLPSKRLQSEMAHKSGMSFQGHPVHY